jgi:serine/threonine protein kinase
MEASVESFCNTLARSNLFSAEDGRAIRQRWLQESKEAASDLNQFTKWLVTNEYLTEYQLGMLHRGHGHLLFLNQYKLLERIGKGRMAGVYRAVHTLGQTVAIKILPPSKARDSAIFARFQREARLALRLKHPNIVRTFQISEANDLHYLVMEYLEGETLEEVLQRRGQLTPGEAVRLVYQGLLGLQHIHEEGLVHRDLKPGNLMLIGVKPETTLSATVKLVDIGTGRALFDEGTPGASPGFELTNEGDLLGTPEYMAPEQARDPHGADIRSDIYSMGCVLYHALAGRPPFNDASRVRLLMRHATEQPKPVKEFNPVVPDGLQQILNWMIAKDPSQRYPTPDRAAQALKMFLVAVFEAPTGDVDQKMQAYLKWLALQGDNAAGTSVPLAVPVSSAGGDPTSAVASPVATLKTIPPLATSVAPVVPIAQPVEPITPREVLPLPPAAPVAIPRTAIPRAPAQAANPPSAGHRSPPTITEDEITDLTPADLVEEPESDADVVELAPVPPRRRRRELDQPRRPAGSNNLLLLLGLLVVGLLAMLGTIAVFLILNR